MAKFADYLKRDLITHTRRVQSLYKRTLRNEESFLNERTDIRYKFVLVRAEFEQHRHVKDMRVAKMLLEEGERKLFLNRHPQPKFFTYSPGGVCFERYYEYPDIHLDLWHPLEKARYPFYFAKREIRKKEFIEMWEKGDGKHSKHDSHH